MQRKRPFTFFEMMVVAAILLLVSVLALPRLSKIPQRISRESALTSIRNAFTEASLRARANGKPLELLLDMDNSQFTIQEISNSLDSIKGWQPSVPKNEEVEQQQSMIVSQNNSFPFPDAIEWLPEETGLDPLEPISFAFFEDGQAAGQPIRFYVGKVHYELNVDKLTGTPLIEELE